MFITRFLNTRFIKNKNLGWFAMELVIVFLGVYLAFLFNGYREEVHERSMQLQYYDSLILEFKVLHAHLDHENGKIQKHLAVVAEIEEGGQPDLLPSDLYYLYRGSVLDAAFSGTNFESLNDYIISNIIGGTPLLETLDETIGQLNRLTATVLLPAQVAATDFYDEQGLKAAFSWYPRLIDEIHTTNRNLTRSVAERAVPGLEERRDELAAQSRWPF